MFYNNRFEKIFLYRPKVDFRKSIDGLCGVIQEEMGLNPLDKILFIFCNTRKNKIKILYWDISGFALWYKRLEKERFFLPKNIEEDQITLESRQLELFLEGYDIWKMRPHQNLSYKMTE
jgi:transposase